MIITAAQSALDVWAAARHHAAHGAEGHPPYEEIFNEPPLPSSTELVATSGFHTYDATKGKYDGIPKPLIDYRILASIETVERALRKCRAPDWFKRYLLFKHPRFGRFAPKRAIVPYTDPEDDARAFVESGHMGWMMGGIASLYLTRSLVRTVRATEREFTLRLLREMANRPDRAPRARGARSDSRARP
jgi:hypothetical protein